MFLWYIPIIWGVCYECVYLCFYHLTSSTARDYRHFLHDSYPSPGISHFAKVLFTKTKISELSMQIAIAVPLLLGPLNWQNQIRYMCILTCVHTYAYKYIIICICKHFPGGSDGKESACNTGDLGLIPELGRSPGEGNGYPLQYSCLENSMDRGAWLATHCGVTKSRTWLSDWRFYFHTKLNMNIYSCLPL